MPISSQAKAMFEASIGWHKPKRATPAVTVDLNGQQVGGPTPADEAVRQMQEVWSDMETIATEIQRLDDLIDRQQDWLDRHEFEHGYPDALRQMSANIEMRNVLWRDRLPALESRANRIVERMNGPEIGELTEVHAFAPLGGFGLMSRFQEIAPLLKWHAGKWPEGEAPF